MRFCRGRSFFEFSDDEVAFTGGVFSLFAGEFNAVADLDACGIAEEIVGLVIAFVLEGDRRRDGGGATRDRGAGLSGFRKQQNRKGGQKNDRLLLQVELQYEPLFLMG